jgi:hypothetical protein
VKIIGIGAADHDGIARPRGRLSQLAASLIGLLIVACSATPAGTAGATTSAAAPTITVSTSAESASASASASTAPTAAASPTKLPASFTVRTEPAYVLKITAGGECIIDANEDWLQYDLLSPVDGKPLASILIGRSEKNPTAKSIRGGGTFTGESLVIDGGTTLPSIPGATAAVPADLHSAKIKGVVKSGGKQITYAIAFTCKG